MPHAIWSNKDIVVEILSRLSAWDLAKLKCTAKSWNDLICDPLFLRVHYQKSRSWLLGYLSQLYINRYVAPYASFYIQENDEFYCYKYINIKQEMRIITSISHGIICSQKSRHGRHVEFEIYIGCLVDSSYIVVRGDPLLDDDTFAFVFEPFGCSSSTLSPSFKVANIYRRNKNEDLYHFSIYSSETGRWKASIEVCRCNYAIQSLRTAFAGGYFHWLAHNRYIIAFHFEEERSHVIELPDYTAEHEDQPWRCDGQRIAESEDQSYLQYVSVSHLEARVWILVNYFEHKWIIKYRFDIPAILKDPFASKHDLGVWEMLCSGKSPYRVRLLCFTSDMITMQVSLFNPFLTYNFRTGKLEGVSRLFPSTVSKRVPTFLPHSLSLAAVHAFKELSRKIDSPPFALRSDTSPPRKIARLTCSVESDLQQPDHCSSEVCVSCEGPKVRPLRNCKSIYRRR